MSNTASLLRALRKFNKSILDKERGAWEDLLAAIKIGEDFVVRATAHGPYDGCFYEPNYWLARPEKNEIHALYVSHYHWRNYGKGEAWSKVLQDFVEKIWLASDHWDEFEVIQADKVKNEHVNNILKIARRAVECDFDFPFVCSCCHQEKRLLDEEGGNIHAEEGNYHGDGGIGIIYEGAVCQECYFAYRCDKCDSFIGQSGKDKYSRLYRVDDDQFCYDCCPKEVCLECGEGLPKGELKHDLCDSCQDDILKEWSKAKKADDTLSVDRLKWVSRRCRNCGESLFLKETRLGGEICVACYQKLK